MARRFVRHGGGILVQPMNMPRTLHPCSGIRRLHRPAYDARLRCVQESSRPLKPVGRRRTIAIEKSDPVALRPGKAVITTNRYAGACENGDRMEPQLAGDIGGSVGAATVYQKRFDAHIGWNSKTRQGIAKSGQVPCLI